MLPFAETLSLYPYVSVYVAIPPALSFSDFRRFILPLAAVAMTAAAAAGVRVLFPSVALDL